ncbi:unnamed protein product [Dicrocoelium dendriticum]|nr:unnamed protein product [Dicrocoelium dendriticum]
MAFTETWLFPDIIDSEVSIPGYHLSRADRHGRKSGGGVILYWRADLKSHLVEVSCDNDSDFDALWCRIHDGCRSSLIGVIYRAPLGAGARLLELIKKHGAGKDCLILGDFNAPNIDWDFFLCNRPPDSFDAAFLDTILDCSLYQHVSMPTRILAGQSPHILDLVLSPAQSDVMDLTVFQPIGKSDHCTILFQWTRRFTVHNSCAVRRNFWRTDALRLKTAASSMDWYIPEQLNVDGAWNLLYSKLTSLIEQVVPISKKRPLSRGPPWIDRDLRSLMNRRRKLWDRFRITRSEHDYISYKTVRNTCTLQKREKRQQYELSLATLSRNTPKTLFSYLKRSTRAGSGIPALCSSEHEDPVHEDTDKASLLARQYSSVYSTSASFTDRTVCTPPSLLEHVDINTDVVLKLLCELDPYSSPGPDDLHPLFLKTVAQYIASPITQVFRRSFQSGLLPTAWKMGIIKPIYKGGNRQDPASYRPICLTSIVCKIMERVLKRALRLHLERLDLISSAQHGFRKARSCSTNLLMAREKWANSLDVGKRMDVVFVDFSKAFDKVPHEQLLYKLRGIGISGNFLSWISDFLHTRSMLVRVNETYSDPVHMTSGVPQGSVLGPELFNIFINDLPSELQSDCLIYADDLKIWKEVSSLEDADRLQETLDLLHTWSIQWHLPINQDKCSVLPIGAPEPLGAYHIGGFLLKNVTSERDLGVIVSPDLRSSQDTMKRVAAAYRMFHAIRRAFCRLTPELFRLLFTSHVRPILEYGLPAAYPLSKSERDMIEKVQRRGSKFVSELRDLPYPLRLRHLNMFSMDYRRRRGDLIFTRRILRGELGRELQEFFHLNIGSSTRGHQWKIFKPRRLKVRSILALSTRVVNNWNRLPPTVVDAQTEDCFKRLLDTHLLNMPGSCCFSYECDGLSGVPVAQ